MNFKNMQPVIYYKFKNTNDLKTIPCTGSGLHVSEIRKGIQLKETLTKSFIDILNSKLEHIPDGDTIKPYEQVIVKRGPDYDFQNSKTKVTLKPKFQKPMSSYQNANLARSEMDDDNKIETIAQQTADIYVPKRFNPNVTGAVPPIYYTCNKCKKKGHYIQDCTADKKVYVNPREEKRGYGLPKEHVVELEKPTEYSFVNPKGQIVALKSHFEALKQKPVKKVPFSESENPKINPIKEIPSCFNCDLCKELIGNSKTTPCCKKSYCSKCILDYLFGGNDETMHTCPNCNKKIAYYDQLIENLALDALIIKWTREQITTEEAKQLCQDPKIIDPIKSRNSPIKQQKSLLINEIKNKKLPTYNELSKKNNNKIDTIMAQNKETCNMEHKLGYKESEEKLKEENSKKIEIKKYDQECKEIKSNNDIDQNKHSLFEQFKNVCENYDNSKLNYVSKNRSKTPRSRSRNRRSRSRSPRSRSRNRRSRNRSPRSSRYECKEPRIKNYNRRSRSRDRDESNYRHYQRGYRNNYESYRHRSQSRDYNERRRSRSRDYNKRRGSPSRDYNERRGSPSRDYNKRRRSPSRDYERLRSRSRNYNYNRHRISNDTGYNSGHSDYARHQYPTKQCNNKQKHSSSDKKHHR